MDEQFVLPGTGVRFGWDSILGLFPGLGDAITSAVSLLIVHHAWQTRASPILIGRMLANIGVDVLLGAVPLVGDAFDFAWKAHRKNARLLEQHLRLYFGEVVCRSVSPITMVFRQIRARASALNNPRDGEARSGLRFELGVTRSF